MDSYWLVLDTTPQVCASKVAATADAAATAATAMPIRGEVCTDIRFVDTDWTLHLVRDESKPAQKAFWWEIATRPTAQNIAVSTRSIRSADRQSRRRIRRSRARAMAAG